MHAKQVPFVNNMLQKIKLPLALLNLIKHFNRLIKTKFYYYL